MATVEDCKKNAEDCARRAREARKPGERKLLLQLAQAWLLLAEGAQILARFLDLG